MDVDEIAVEVGLRLWWRPYQYLCVALGFIASPFASKSKLADWFYRESVLDRAMIISAS